MNDLPETINLKDRVVQEALRPRWILFRCETENLDDLKDNPLVFCDGEIVLLKSLIATAVDQVCGNESTYCQRIAPACQKLFERIKLIVNSSLGEEDASSKVPTPEGETGTTPDKSGPIAGRIGSADGTTPDGVRMSDSQESKGTPPQT